MYNVSSIFVKSADHLDLGRSALGCAVIFEIVNLSFHLLPLF